MAYIRAAEMPSLGHRRTLSEANLARFDAETLGETSLTAACSSPPPCSTPWSTAWRIGERTLLQGRDGAAGQAHVPRRIEHVFSPMAGAMTAAWPTSVTRTGLFRAMQGQGPHVACRGYRRVKASSSRATGRGLVEGGHDRGVATSLLRAGRIRFRLSDDFPPTSSPPTAPIILSSGCGSGPALMQVAPRVAEAFRAGAGGPSALRPDCARARLINRASKNSASKTDYWPKALPEANGEAACGAACSTTAAARHVGQVLHRAGERSSDAESRL